jgi:AraC-like DNA-binding protein
MTPTPTIDRSIVTSIVVSIEALQGDIGQLVEASGLGRIWSTPDVEVLPEDRVWKLFELSARSLDMPDVGLRVGSEFQIRNLGRFGRQLESSLTVFSCLSEYVNTVNRYSSHSRFWLEMREGGGWFCRRGIDLIEAGRNEVEQFALQLMIRLVQLACGPTWMPTQVAIQQSTDRCFRDLPTYDGVQIRCRQPSTAIWLSSLEMLSVVAWHDDAIVKHIRDRISLGRDDAPPTITSAARQLGFSVRTLQRELSLQGLDWSRLLDQVRLSHAVRLLLTEMSLAEIARDLGYTDQANFGRAFRRWTGATPRSYRRIVLPSQSPSAQPLEVISTSAGNCTNTRMQLRASKAHSKVGKRTLS